jgi:hypothetical protein
VRADSRWKFSADRRKPVYRTLAAELDAIRRGTKAISFFATDKAGLAEDLAEIQPLALARGLCVTIAPRAKAIDVFVHRASEAHRIASLQALLSSSPWTFDHEASLGLLLGYSAQHRKAWLAAERHARPGFGVLTVYGEGLENHAPPSLWWIEPGRVVALDAYEKRPRGLELWRVGVDRAYARRFEPEGYVLLFNESKQRTFERAMRTSYEVLGRKGWCVATL